MLDRRLKIFFSGIGGSGVSAIAHFISEKGHTVYGSDRAFELSPSHPALRPLKNKGIRIVSQDGLSIDGSFDLVVFSTAVEKERPEFVRAKALKIPIKTRPEFLAEIVSGYKSVAVAGTSGKSTVSGMLAVLMRELGLSPNFIGGGRVKQFKSETNPGNSISGESESLVFEACESDDSIRNYSPLYSIVLNVALDHQTPEKTRKNTRSMTLVNGDDEDLARIAPHAVTYSIDNPSKYRAEDIKQMPFGSEFTINGTVFELGLPGRHNILNALASIALLSEIGIETYRIASVLRKFKGLERRFDILLNDDRFLVIDDYAHSPHKISALMQAISNIRDGVCYIFQPHGFSPTRLMKDEYIKVFRENLRRTDHLILLPIYYAGGSVSRDISSRTLAEGINNETSVETVSDRMEIFSRLDKWDSYVVLGARDETLCDFAKEIARMKINA
jgi:UDP-N-acetylmuramate--alanine ligase